MMYQFFDNKTGSRASANKNLAQELQKPVIKKKKKKKKNSKIDVLNIYYV